jgi:hypothetical protein
MRKERQACSPSAQALFLAGPSRLHQFGGEIMERSPGEFSNATGEARERVERAERHALQIPLRYRIEGQQDWSKGETLNLSESGILFSSESLLEVDTRLEITFQTSGVPLLSSSTRLARVVRRILSNWPETRPAVGAKFHS